jgi:hypothetical protein
MLGGIGNDRVFDAVEQQANQERAGIATGESANSISIATLNLRAPFLSIEFQDPILIPFRLHCSEITEQLESHPRSDVYGVVNFTMRKV